MKILPLFLLLAAPFLARAQSLQFEASLWQMTPEGDVTVGSDGSPGTQVSLEDDLGYEDAESIVGFDAVLGSSHQIAVSYFNFDLSAQNSIDRSVRFGDVDFDFNADVSSHIEASLLRAAYRYAAGSDTFRGGFLLGGQYVDLTADATATGFGSASESAQVVLPAVGGFARWKVAEFLSLQASLTGGSWQWDDISATFLDAEGSARFYVGNVFAGIGYRHLALEGEDESIPVKVDLTFAGPTVHAGFSW